MRPTPETPGPLVPQNPIEHRDPQDLWTLGPPGTSEPQNPWEITSTVWNPESKHPDTLKLKHNQRTFLNYIIEQSKPKIACTFWGYFIYRVLTIIISGQSPLCFPPATSLLSTKNYNQRYLIGYTWIEKISRFLTLQYVKISVKTPFFYYRYNKENKYFRYIRQINHSLQKDTSDV